MTLNIKNNPLFYQERLQRRQVQDIDLVVIHCTELPNLALAREFGQRIHHADSQTGNSGHFYIDRDGSVEQFVAPEFVAHHVKGYNASSIGVELVNNGRYPHWFSSNSQVMSDTYPNGQIDALVQLIEYLKRLCPAVRYVAGHEDLDQTKVPSEDDPGKLIRRKIDPGPMFPWETVMASVDLERYKS